MSARADDPMSDGEAPELGNLGRNEKSGLGSLAQSARDKHLRQARGLMFAVGGLLLVIHGLDYVTAENTVHTEIEKQVKNAGPGIAFDRAKLNDLEEAAVREVKLMSSVLMAVGAAFIVLGLLVSRLPVPAIAIGIVLFIGTQVAYIVHDPESIRRGIIWKIIVLVALLKSLQAAIAYQREARLVAGNDMSS
jgi:hypothetical protein